MTALSDALTVENLRDSVKKGGQDARSDRSEWTEGDVADDAAEACRWGYGGDPARLEGEDE